jgi:predicted nucleotidyltransferase
VLRRLDERNFRFAIGQDVFDLVHGERRKDRDGDATRIVNTEVHREPIHAVARDDGDAVTAPHARDMQRAGDRMRTLPHTAG